MNKFRSLPLGELGVAVESERPLRASPIARVATDHDPDLPDPRGPPAERIGTAPRSARSRRRIPMSGTIPIAIGILIGMGEPRERHQRLSQAIYLDLFSALGGTRIPNLLIRRWLSTVAARARSSRAVASWPVQTAVQGVVRNVVQLRATFWDGFVGSNVGSRSVRGVRPG